MGKGGVPSDCDLAGTAARHRAMNMHRDVIFIASPLKLE
jgi:hypothetical protein